MAQPAEAHDVPDQHVRIGTKWKISCLDFLECGRVKELRFA